ncbi:hypothetical protein BO70DRAFT_356255 [Aspergillus heteromorphus CBS 117.55]|uniref:F-box domain-containing protein n=1 Tax=Aspergillus heteromorphus CBS 117.55 TaxID=1448321 RepID=A0A317V0X1_9EURO|nr:uncharacterized protein BO70DRAFT_356255 [Aspergillus heteromorphus CBS 117.55]PWY67923.1 hypothetical protein BO70DRAFT_356255 [Aspergillus heteromorphus CBS 117.55]
MTLGIMDSSVSNGATATRGQEAGRLPVHNKYYNSMDPSTATRQALATPELRELIFRQLHWRALFSAQRVCRSWNSQIRDSSFFQEVLFLKPFKHAPVERSVNPILAEVFPFFFRNNETVYPQCKDDGCTLGELDMIKNPSRKAAYLRPEASWRRMLVQQPPIRTLGVYRASFGPFGFGGKYVALQIREDRKAQDGARMAMLFELLCLDKTLTRTFEDVNVLWSEESANDHAYYENGEWLDITPIPEVMLVNIFARGCSDSDFECDDQEVVDGIQASYRSLGLTPQTLGDEWETTVKMWQGTWD